jgi:cytoskeletal protein RodZ
MQIKFKLTFKKIRVMKKALALILVAVFGTAVMFAQDVKPATQTTPEKKETKTTTPAKKEAAKPGTKTTAKPATKTTAKPAAKPGEKPAEKTTQPVK